MNNYQAVILFCGIDAIAILIVARILFNSIMRRINTLEHSVKVIAPRPESDHTFDALVWQMNRMDDAYSAKIAELTARIEELTAQGQEVERSVSRAFMRSDSDAKTIAGLTRALQAFAPRADRR